MRIEAIAWFDVPNNGKWHGQNVMPQQELIRCRECRHYAPMDSSRPYDCAVGMADTMPEDYCSRAERREE